MRHDPGHQGGDGEGDEHRSDRDLHATASGVALRPAHWLGPAAVAVSSW
jgi:hypothetical protein